MWSNRRDPGTLQGREVVVMLPQLQITAAETQRVYTISLKVHSHTQSFSYFYPLSLTPSSILQLHDRALLFYAGTAGAA